MKFDSGEVVASEDERKENCRIREGGSIAGAYRNRRRHGFGRRTEKKMKHVTRRYMRVSAREEFVRKRKESGRCCWSTQWRV